jgi:hypothetical protein
VPDKKAPGRSPFAPASTETKEPECTAAERLDRALRTVIKVPKEALLKEEAKEKRRRARKKQDKKPS